LCVLFSTLISCQDYKPEVIYMGNKKEFQNRLIASESRLVSSDIPPVFTGDFILADIKLDPEYPRRFSNYSGDLSGRYIEVMSLRGQEDDEAFLSQIVNTALKYQKKDGRFGSDTLDFRNVNITGEHMALLWGNGRLLVGLMAYYRKSGDQEVLQAARKLGDFYLTTYEACATPENISKLADFGAMGIICFTQYIEGMTELFQETRKPEYLEICQKVYPILPPRGNQHAHGYLSTLRGVLKLYELTGNEEDLDFVIMRYNDLKNSTDYTVFGSVMEFFGGKGLRDEGCASADFVRLALHLFRITSDQGYLNDAEMALYNALYFNQYPTGDFGHHILTINKQVVYEEQKDKSTTFSIDGVSSHYRMAAWWCCTMHGLRCLQDVMTRVVSLKEGALYVDLYLETQVTLRGSILTISRNSSSDYPLYYEFEFINPLEDEIYLRIPAWASRMDIYKNGKPLKAEKKGNYLHIPGKINKNDRLGVGFALKIRIHGSDGRMISSSMDDFSGYIFYGPYLMGIDDVSDPDFLSEPNDNRLILESIREEEPSGKEQNGAFSLALQAKYHHSGFPSELRTILQPVKEYTFKNQPNASIKFSFESGKQTENE
jgi:DUF1680 family protein